jgi:hypothetical protein
MFSLTSAVVEHLILPFFYQIKVTKTYPGYMLPPGVRK